MATTTQRAPRDEQVDSAMQMLWRAHEQEREERRLLMELLRDCHRMLFAMSRDRDIVDLPIYDGPVGELATKLREVLHGTPIARVMRPDEDADMEVPF